MSVGFPGLPGERGATGKSRLWTRGRNCGDGLFVSRLPSVRYRKTARHLVGDLFFETHDPRIGQGLQECDNIRNVPFAGRDSVDFAGRCDGIAGALVTVGAEVCVARFPNGQSGRLSGSIGVQGGDWLQVVPLTTESRSLNAPSCP